MFRLEKMAVILLLSVCLAISVGTSAALALDPARLQVTIPKINQAPVLDGKLDDAAWLTASIKGGKFVSDVSSIGDKLVDYPRIAYVGYTSDALYVAYMIFAPDPTKFVEDQPKWSKNDEVEIIVQPNQTGTITQYGIVTNGITNVPDVKAVVVKSGIRVLIEAEIPWTALKVAAPKAGDKWGFHLSGYQSDPKIWMSYSYASAYKDGSMMGVAVFGE